MLFEREREEAFWDTDGDTAERKRTRSVENTESTTDKHTENVLPCVRECAALR